MTVGSDAAGVEDGARATDAGGASRLEPVFESVGDSVCWLERVCPDCGALIEERLPASCWRCGATVG
ncbi:hypothetical protein [Humibacter albus]|uniref:hypothetical protein n=1 Tax=Humibacter albus TaxID=427754 RepID=UPI0003B46976|nr:hypothetical protein [Humibacter albus]